MDLPTLTQASLSLQRADYNYNANQNIRRRVKLICELSAFREAFYVKLHDIRVLFSEFE